MHRLTPNRLVSERRLPCVCVSGPFGKKFFWIYTLPNNVLVPLLRPQKPEVFGCNLEVIIWKNLLLARIF
jgi:hypothetical protein